MVSHADGRGSTKRKAQGPSRTCDESEEEEKEKTREASKEEEEEKKVKTKKKRRSKDEAEEKEAKHPLGREGEKHLKSKHDETAPPPSPAGKRTNLY